MKDQNPFKPFVPFNAVRLVVGTIPPHRFCLTFNPHPPSLKKGDVLFYYGSKDNHFWPLIENTCHVRFSYIDTNNAIEERKMFLQSRQLGITDMVERCNRNGNSSLDCELRNIEYRKLDELLTKHPSINELIYTSLFAKCCAARFLSAPHYRQERFFLWKNKCYRYHVLYSPSPLALRGLGTNGKSIRQEQYKQIFSNKIP